MRCEAFLEGIDAKWGCVSFIGVFSASVCCVACFGGVCRVEIGKATESGVGG